MAVSYKDALLVLLRFQMVIQITKTVCRRIIFIASRPGSRQSAAWHCMTEQNVTDRAAAFLSGKRDM